MSGLSLGKKFLFMGVLIVVILTGLHYSAGAIDRFTPLGSAVRDVMAPVQRVLMLVGREIYDFASAPARLIGLSERNQILEQRNRELESQLLQFKEFEEENYRLKNMLEFKTGMDPQLDTEVAAVTGRDHGNWFGSIMINKGANKGIRRDMAVITPAGLVGKVFRVSRHTAEVLLITDPRSGVGSLVQETRAHGILEGVPGGGLLRMVNIPTDQAPAPGDNVITSGLGSVFPKGIPLGTVQEVQKEQSGLFKMAVVDPYVDFSRLEEVLVIKSFSPAEPENAGR
ncbi:MAG: rod shape-determining protein MreC [Firmicutes bacterium]|nr:rod shape-determining protein MreC [Bacillota bacterium]